MGILTILSGVLGAGTGLLQGFIETRQDNKTKLALARIQKDKDIALAKEGIIESQNNLKSAKEDTQQSENNKLIKIAESQKEEYQAFANNVKETSALWNSDSRLANISNFIVSTTRPFITYILVIASVIMGIILTFSKAPNANIVEIFDSLLIICETVLGYWFVRRSYEKNNQKKKSS